MRILQIFDKPEAGGGLRQHVDLVRSIWADAGHEVARLRLTHPRQPQEHDGERTWPQTFAPVDGRRRAREFRRMLAGIAPDMVHLHAGFTSLSAPLIRVLRDGWPTLGILHDVVPFCFLGTRRFRFSGVPCERRCGWRCFASGCYASARPWTLARHAYHGRVRRGLLAEWRRLPGVVAPSPYLAELAGWHGIPASRISVVAHPTPLCPVPPLPEPTCPRVLYVGSLLPIKGAHLLVEALARLSTLPWTAEIVGEGPARADLELAIAERGLQGRIRMCGTLAGAALEAAYAASSMVVVPSIVPEGLGMVGLEAMARGRPVVGFALGGAAHWLKDGDTGWVARPTTAEALADSLREALTESPERERRGSQGRTAVEQRFSPASYLAAMASVHGAILRPPRPAEGHR